MPLYVYRCSACGFSQEHLRRIDQRDEPTVCLSCGRTIRRRVPSVVTFTFAAPIQQVGDTTIKPRGSTV